MVRKIKNFFHYFNALAAVIFYGNPARKLKVIGVTGTDGKTTTSTLIYHILNQSGFKVALITTVGGFIGDQEIDTGFHTTTPSPWALQEIIKQIADSGFEYLVLESTSHGIDQSRLLSTNPSIGVLTNISHEHLDYHGSIDNYLAVKAKLFKSASYAVLNATDWSYEPLKKIIKSLVVPYSDSDVPKYVTDRFPEKYNQLNAQAAVAVARLLNLSEVQIGAAIASFQGVSGRVEEVENQQGIKVVVDFAHTPNAVENVLSALKKSTKGKLITVLGATGRRDPTKRPKMGKIAAELSDFFILTSDDTYGENIYSIINQLKSGMTKGHGNIISLPDRAKAIQYAINKAVRGDMVALLGQGHEKSLNLDGKTELPWSDQKAAQKALTNRKAL